MYVCVYEWLCMIVMSHTWMTYEMICMKLICVTWVTRKVWIVTYVCYQIYVIAKLTMLWWFMWSLWVWQEMNDVCSMRMWWVISLYMIMYLWLQSMKKDMYINGYASKCCITWDLKGLVTVYSSHCDHDTDRYDRPTVVNPGHDRRLRSVNPGNWSTVINPGHTE